MGAGERYDPKDPWTDPSCESFDDAALARTVATFEEDANLLTFVANPLLQLDQFNVQLAELVLVFLALQLRLSARTPACVLRTSGLFSFELLHRAFPSPPGPAARKRSILKESMPEPGALQKRLARRANR